MATQEKICLIEKIEEILGDVSSRFLMERCGYIRLNACDVGLDIRAGTVYLDLQNEAIICLGNSSNLEYYGGFQYVDGAAKMVVQAGSQKISIYLAEENDRVNRCFDYYNNVYLPDLEKQEFEASKTY